MEILGTQSSSVRGLPGLAAAGAGPLRWPEPLTQEREALPESFQKCAKALSYLPKLLLLS